MTEVRQHKFRSSILVGDSKGYQDFCWCGQPRSAAVHSVEPPVDWTKAEVVKRVCIHCDSTTVPPLAPDKWCDCPCHRLKVKRYHAVQVQTMMCGECREEFVSVGFPDYCPACGVEFQSTADLSEETNQ